MCLVATLTGCGDDGSSAPAPVVPRCTIAAVAAGALGTDGTRLVDEHGRVITLRGINAGGRSKFAPYSPFDYAQGGFDEALAAYLDRATAWGFDVLRVPFSWAAAEPDKDSWDEEFLERYDQLLDAAWQRGMWTIVDFHQDIYAEAYCGDGFPPWTLDDPPEPHLDCPQWFLAYYGDEDVKAAFDAFWSDSTGVRTEFGQMWDMMVGRHKDRAGVIGFEIINEPSPGNAERVSWEQQVLEPFYTELIARIQALDPDALVLFDVSGAQALYPDTAMPRPDGTNIVFAPHFYAQGALFGNELDEDVLTPLTVWRDQGEAWDLPVLVGEFGIKADHPRALEHARGLYEALEQLGLHGTWWEYSDSTELWNEEDLSVVGPDGQPREAMLDGIVRPYARALDGELSEQHFDPVSRRLSLRYTPATGGVGVSEIVLPERLYGAGVQIGGEGACVDLRGDRLLVRADAGAGSVQLVIEPQ